MRKSLLFISMFFISQFSFCQNDNIDKSKTLEEYYKLGIPSIENEWSELDLEKTLAILEKQKGKNILSLPRKKSIKSSKLFNKIINQIPSFSNTTSRDIKNESIKHSNFGKIIYRLSGIYSYVEKTPSYYNDESTEIDEKLITESSNFALLFFYNISFMTKETRETKKSSINRFQKGITDTYLATLEYFRDSKEYKYENKVQFSMTISQNLKRIGNKLNQDSKDELILIIEEIIVISTIPKVTENLSEGLKYLK